MNKTCKLHHQVSMLTLSRDFRRRIYSGDRGYHCHCLDRIQHDLVPDCPLTDTTEHRIPYLLPKRIRNMHLQATRDYFDIDDLCPNPKLYHPWTNVYWDEIQDWLAELKFSGYYEETEPDWIDVDLGLIPAGKKHKSSKGKEPAEPPNKKFKPIIVSEQLSQIPKDQERFQKLLEVQILQKREDESSPEFLQRKDYLLRCNEDCFS